MTAVLPEAAVAHLLELPDSGPFDSKKWLNYFEENRKTQAAIRLPEKIELPESMRLPLIRSLQRFQIGETGDGRHLKKFASRVEDIHYLQCVNLFVREEQVHGQILAEVILSMDGSLLSWHWTDLAFIALRRLFGLKTEIFIILIAEIIGKCFYRLIAEKVEDQLIANAFAVIVCDEIGHLRFHCEFLQLQMSKFSRLLKKAVHSFWMLIFFAAVVVFVFDHRRTLLALDCTPRAFIEKCFKEFRRAARCTFSLIAF